LVPADRFEAPFLVTQDYIKYAVVLAEMRNGRAYESICSESIKQFGDANPQVVERVVKTCSLLPSSASLLASLSPSAEKLIKSVPTDAEQKDWAMPWQCLSVALFEYRCGNYAEAVDWANRGLSFKEDSAMERVAGVQAILAMSYHQLGQAEKARSALRRSRELVEPRWKSPFTANDCSHGWWYDWFFARILEAEAASMIEPRRSGEKR